jgi:hypothetical protein
METDIKLPEKKNYSRQLLELKDQLDERLNTTIEWYAKQVELDKCNEEQLIMIDKLQRTEFEFNERRSNIIREYMDKVARLVPDRITNSGLTYIKAMYIGKISKYNGILGGFDYYLKFNDNGTLDIYDDAEFTKFITNIDYIPNEWRLHKLDII